MRYTKPEEASFNTGRIDYKQAQNLTHLYQNITKKAKTINTPKNKTGQTKDYKNWYLQLSCLTFSN